MSVPTLANRYQQRALKPGFRVRGIYVARFLVVLLLVLDIALVFAIFYSRNGLAGYHLQNRQVRRMENALVKLRNDNRKLFDLIQSLKNDPKAQERLVRRQLGWVGKNEIIFESPHRIEASGPVRPFDFPK
ncbi:MAG: FtsB family cell division protein [Syntrophobacteraceae bacterium]